MAKAEKVGPKKGEKFDCPGCGKYRTYESGGLCGACRRKQISDAKALPIGPVVKPSAEYPDLASDVAGVKAGFGKVPNAEGVLTSFGVDPVVHMALRDAWYEVERKALESLSGLFPASVLVRAANLVQRIQALEP